MNMSHPKKQVVTLDLAARHTQLENLSIRGTAHTTLCGLTALITTTSTGVTAVLTVEIMIRRQGKTDTTTETTTTDVDEESTEITIAHAADQSTHRPPSPQIGSVVSMTVIEVKGEVVITKNQDLSTTAATVTSTTESVSSTALDPRKVLDTTQMTAAEFKTKIPTLRTCPLKKIGKLEYSFFKSALLHLKVHLWF